MFFRSTTIFSECSYRAIKLHCWVCHLTSPFRDNAQTFTHFLRFPLVMASRDWLMHRIFDLQCFFNKALKSLTVFHLSEHGCDRVAGTVLFEVRWKTFKEQCQRKRATFLEYFHAAKMCCLSIPLGQIRLGADQKRIFLTTLMFLFLWQKCQDLQFSSLWWYRDIGTFKKLLFSAFCS